MGEGIKGMVAHGFVTGVPLGGHVVSEELDSSSRHAMWNNIFGISSFNLIKAVSDSVYGQKQSQLEKVREWSHNHRVLEGPQLWFNFLDSNHFSNLEHKCGIGSLSFSLPVIHVPTFLGEGLSSNNSKASTCSNSNSVEIKRNNGGFWKIGKLFRKKKEKDRDCERSVNGGGFDERSDTWMADHGGVSRSRSLCSFRNDELLFGSEDGRDSILSGARSSISAARSSGVNAGLVMDSGRRNGYSEAEPRRSGFDGEKRDSFMELDGGGGIYGVNRRVFSLRERVISKAWMNQDSYI
ncbi:acylamino-acid-releasing enzyme [Senna tora]|uniref:Acylamino-acid-releasing enzyme n=1 Tax=Senna tora TaxID=362788 RepID=A0A834WI86_9FABA|nr:acylamino-acid-releasing enzyme [Senna tora]